MIGRGRDGALYRISWRRLNEAVFVEGRAGGQCRVATRRVSGVVRWSWREVGTGAYPPRFMLQGARTRGLRAGYVDHRGSIDDEIVLDGGRPGVIKPSLPRTLEGLVLFEPTLSHEALVEAVFRQGRRHDGRAGCEHARWQGEADCRRDVYHLATAIWKQGTLCMLEEDGARPAAPFNCAQSNIAGDARDRLSGRR